jgi:hypothetical protein
MWEPDKQIHGRKRNRLISPDDGARHELPSNSYIINRREDMIEEELHLLGNNAVYFAESQPTFRKIPPLSSGSKNKPSKKSERSR